MLLSQSSNNLSLSNTGQSERYRFVWVSPYKKEYSSKSLCWEVRENGLETEEGCALDVGRATSQENLDLLRG